MYCYKSWQKKCYNIKLAEQVELDGYAELVRLVALVELAALDKEKMASLLLDEA